MVCEKHCKSFENNREVQIALFWISHCNASRSQISYFHLFPGWVIPLLWHLAPWPDFRLQPQMWQLEVGTNFSFSNLGKGGLHCDQQGLMKTKAWIYTWLCSDTATGTASTSWAAHSSVPDHTRGGGTLHSWCEVRLPLIIISSFSPTERG